MVVTGGVQPMTGMTHARLGNGAAVGLGLLALGWSGRAGAGFSRGAGPATGADMAH